MRIAFLQQFLSIFARYTVRFTLLFTIMATALLASELIAQQQRITTEREEAAESAQVSTVFYELELSSFTDTGYRQGVKRLLQSYEQESGQLLEPQDKGKVALKLDTRRGLGLSPNKALVNALIAELQQRGFKRENILLVDQREYSMRHAGFLPPLSTGGRAYEGSPVYYWYSWDFVDPVWFYDNALRGELPPTFLQERLAEVEVELNRCSFLPYLLIEEVDFWINLPVFAHFPVTDFSGALMNASLFNVTNEERFFRNRVNAPVAIAEINAIPELREKMRFSLVSLERYQFEGGVLFNANYSHSEPILWLSNDPVALDAAGLDRINWARERAGFKAFELPHPVLEYAEQLEVGSATRQPEKLQR